MIKPLNPYSNTAKTAEIMSRYRPIATKPETCSNSMSDQEDSSLSQKIRQSPYLKNLWLKLQDSSTRTRRRGNASLSLPFFKRQKTHVLGFCHVTSPSMNLSLRSYAPQFPLLNLPVLNFENTSSNSTTPALVIPPLLPCFPFEQKAVLFETHLMKPGKEEVIDFNTMTDIPEEQDLLVQLQEPTVCNVITPQPISPVGSIISVELISEDPRLTPSPQVLKRKDEVKEEVESEVLPAVISDSNNKVRMANSAYKKMVGQPKCSWLDFMVAGDGPLRSGACGRICGEVLLHLCDSTIPTSTNGFACWVRIKWQTNEKSTVNAFCDVIRVCCESRDYVFAWKIC